jgi:hypothetical protein
VLVPARCVAAERPYGEVLHGRMGPAAIRLSSVTFPEYFKTVSPYAN